MKLQAVQSALPHNPSMGTLPFILYLPLTGDQPCLNFVNTVDRRLRPDKCRDRLLRYSDLLAFRLRLDLIGVESYTALSAQAELAPQAAERAISEAQAFRAAFTTLLEDLCGAPGTASTSPPDQAALASFDSFRRQARKSEAPVWEGRRMLFISRPEQEGLDLPTLLLVRDADELLRSPQAVRVRICAAEGCCWAFLDGSRNGGRRWCSMKLCGNREKASRFRSRQ
jgi:predicted RNA-binding Zn ribbon-like protein